MNQPAETQIPTGEVELQVEASPIILSTDRTLFVQLLQNLLGNALKFTPQDGRIEVRLTREYATAVVQVRDTAPLAGLVIVKLAVSPVTKL